MGGILPPEIQALNYQQHQKRKELEAEMDNEENEKQITEHQVAAFARIAHDFDKAIKLIEATHPVKTRVKVTLTSDEDGTEVKVNKWQD